MRNEQQLLRLDSGYYQETQFKTIALTQTDTVGKPLGVGKCKAVVLYLNRHLLNNTNGDINNCLYLYYGDRQQQARELEAGQMSDIIFCNDLSEVYVRCPFDPSGIDIEAFLQITIYHDAEEPSSNLIN